MAYAQQVDVPTRKLNTVGSGLMKLAGPVVAFVGHRQERARWTNLKHFHEVQPGIDRGSDPMT